MLLFHIKGPTCFKDLKTINNKLCSTYKEACNELNLLPDDTHLYKCLEEANISESPNALRELFA